MAVHPRYTTVVQLLDTPFGTLVREDYYRYPESESNLYLIDGNSTPIWFAERPMDDDAYANPVVSVNPTRVRCGTRKGFDCEIDLRSGKLIRAEFTK